jgi:hypothetical protein
VSDRELPVEMAVEMAVELAEEPPVETAEVDTGVG